MEHIEWEKAPEGATHFNEVSGVNRRLYPWMQLLDGVWFYYRDERWNRQHDNQHDKFPDTHDQLVERPTSWNGSGKPPVGTVCEWCPNQDGWVQVEILGHNGEETWFRRAGESISETCLRMAFFRPIRTPEQIATEQRDAAAHAMVNVTAGAKDWMEAFRMLHDAGLRFKERP